jgi:hypothetical protein
MASTEAEDDLEKKHLFSHACKFKFQNVSLDWGLLYTLREEVI